jgi:hypothetical protein
MQKLLKRKDVPDYLEQAHGVRYSKSTLGGRLFARANATLDWHHATFTRCCAPATCMASLRQSASHHHAIAPGLRRAPAHRHRHVAAARRLAAAGDRGKMRCPCHERGRPAAKLTNRPRSLNEG